MVKRARKPMVPICSTCLSRDRVLLPLPIHESLVMFFQDIKLTESQRVCWECRAMINKIILFRERAIKAQRALKQMTRKKKYNIQSLSDLKECYVMPEGSVIIGVQLDEDDAMNEVKIEQNHESEIENFHQNDEVEIEIGNLKNDIDDKNLQSQNFSELDNIEDTQQSDREENFFENDMNDDDSDFKSDTEKSSPKPKNEDKSKTEEESDDDAPPPKKKRKKDDDSSDEDYVDDSYNKVKKTTTKPSKKYTKNDECVKYRLKKMSEEEMLQARERKRDSEIFQNSCYKCNKCIEIFESKEELGCHMKNHNKFLGVVSCDICELRFNFKNAHEMHVAGHYRCYSCFVCEWECENMTGMLEHHEARHEYKPWQCLFCGRQFLTRGAYKLHSRVLHQKDCVCPLCSRQLKHHSSVLKHIRSMHGAPRVECHICHKSVRARGLKSHLKSHEHKERDESAYCVECDVQFRDEYTFKEHFKSSKHVAPEDQPFPCPHCAMRFPGRFRLQCHIDAKHTEGFNYSCRLCHKQFKTVKAMRLHVRERHEGRRPPRNKMCDLCGRGFSVRKVLINHIRTHTGERPFECSYCNARFAQKSAMLSHRRTQHERDRDGKK